MRREFSSNSRGPHLPKILAAAHAPACRRNRDGRTHGYRRGNLFAPPVRRIGYGKKYFTMPAETAAEPRRRRASRGRGRASLSVRLSHGL
jgi:hypothetical protein